jgi:hypothetical protein
MLVLLQSLAGTLGATISIALTESRTKGSDDPAVFTEAQQFTFTALLPLLLASVFVSLIGRSTAKKEPEPEEVTSAPAPAR